MKVTINESIRTVTFRADTGEELVFHADRASAETNAYATLHGWKQRIADKMAVGVDADTGRRIPDAEKLAIVQPLVAHYESGSPEWELRVSGGAASLLVRALVQIGLMSDTPENRAKVRGWDARTRTAVEMRPDVKAAMDAMRAEVTRDINTDDLISTLG